MSLLQDVKFSLRMARQNWHLVAWMLLTISVAVATGATTLSVVNAVLLRPLPISESDRLFRVRATGEKSEPRWVSWPAFNDWQASLRRQQLAGYTMADFSVLGGDGPESILAAFVSPSYFEVMRVGPHAGRVFDSTEYASGSERVVMLTHGFWQRRYGGDRGLIGRRIQLTGPEYMKGGDGDYTVVGILPETFWPFWKQLEVIVPLRPSAAQATGRGRAAVESVISRLADGATSEEATAELTTIVSSLKAQHGSAEPVAAVRVIPVRDAQYANFRDRLLLVMACAGVMFVLAVVNVATLLLAQAVARQQEFAVRLALGGRQGHLVRQAMVEGFLLGGIGGAAGLMLGTAGTSAIRVVIPVDLLNRLPGEAAAITLDSRVIALTAAAVLLMSVAYGIATAASIRGVRAHLALREDARGATEAPRHGRARATMLGVQLTLAVALVLAVTVLSLNLSRLQSIGVGIAPQDVYRVWLNLSPSRYPTPESRIAYYDRVLERVASGAGIESAGGIDLPFNEDWQSTRVAVDNQQTTADQMPEALTRAVTTDYFSTVGIRVLNGRAIEDADRSGTMPVAVVSRALATRVWPKEIRLVAQSDRIVPTRLRRGSLSSVSWTISGRPPRSYPQQSSISPCGKTRHRGCI